MNWRVRGCSLPTEGSLSSARFDRRSEPGEVGFGAGDDRQHDELGRVVGMQIPHLPFEFGETLGARLDDQEILAAVFYLVLPGVERLNRVRNDVHAGGQTPFDDRAGNLARLFE